MSYFSITTKPLQEKGLRIAIVYLYEQGVEKFIAGVHSLLSDTDSQKKDLTSEPDVPVSLPKN